MLQRELQVSSPTFALKNPVRDKWTQQPHPAEDRSSRAGPTDAAHAPRFQPAACGEDLKAILDQPVYVQKGPSPGEVPAVMCHSFALKVDLFNAFSGIFFIMVSLGHYAMIQSGQIDINIGGCS